MNFDQVASQMSPTVYQQLKTAVELGRWPDGKPLSAEQKQISLQAVLRYEVEHLPPEQRTGYIPPKIGSQCHREEELYSADDAQALRWKD